MTEVGQDPRSVLLVTLSKLDIEIKAIEAHLIEKRQLKSQLLRELDSYRTSTRTADKAPAAEASCSSDRLTARQPSVWQDFRPRAVPLFLKNGFTTNLSAEEEQTASSRERGGQDQLKEPVVIAPEPELSPDEKRTLFLSLFLGRKDVFAARVISYDAKGGIAKTAYMPVWQRFGKEVIDDHLCGRAVLGVYPMIEQTRCHFIVLDFDEETWREDALVVIQAARKFGIPVAPEISRSGKGLHLWIFFSEPVPAERARRLGAALLAEATAQNGSPRLLSFDRMIPAQDRLHDANQIGNLIALPLQLHRRRFCTTVFTDDELRPIPHQWAYLQKITRLSRAELDERLEALEKALGAPISSQLPRKECSRRTNASVGVDESQFELVAEDYFAYEATRLCAAKTPLQILRSNCLSFDLDALTPELRSHLIRLASFWNPEYLRRRRELRSTFETPRKFILADQRFGQLMLPRGLFDKVVRVLRNNAIPFEVEDRRFAGIPIDTEFNAFLKPDQAEALEAMLSVEHGILVASTGFGKTVLAFALIHSLKTSSMILVHSAEIAKQWADGAKRFLGLTKKRGRCLQKRNQSSDPNRRYRLAA